MKNASLTDLRNQFGDAFYLLDSMQFRKNFHELKEAFQSIYPLFNIAYSYKTNYTPKLCKIINDLGGLAEVVSEMELEIARRVGVPSKKTIWNGPVKNYTVAESFLLEGGILNVDSQYEIELLKTIAQEHPSSTLNIGIRVNFPIGDGVTSRFGFDIDSDEFKDALDLSKIKHIRLVCLHCHFASRNLEYWKPRVIQMFALIDELGIQPEMIDLGGGLYGKMPPSLQAQFSSVIPTYEEYASEIAPLFLDEFGKNGPMLLIEPGSALVGDCMTFVTTVKNIKDVRGKKIATVLGSVYNINPTLNKKNPPIEIVSTSNSPKEYEDLDFGGYTCIESDYLYKGYSGKLSVGDVVLFKNVGSYSIVLKPPFILPNFPILDISEGDVSIIKQQESFDDLFQTYEF